MNLFDVMLKNYFDEKMLDKLSRVKILLIGCGGLGSNVAVMLIRSGIKNLTIVDFDEVDILNLNRQNYFLHHVGEKKVLALKDTLFKINPHANIAAKNIKIDESNLDEL
ncbi:MAG TPA: sulfur carrier protein ThiS adenylyltransferase ThiF, partial [Thermoanaerobacter sp.]|nr:sulfur carrier protein ThiS adenylyltransferase ThiF [Thermoanaerobacter sp.]